MFTSTHDCLSEAYAATARDAELVMMEESLEAQREQDLLAYTGLAFSLTSWQPYLGDLDLVIDAVEAGCPF